MTGAPFAAGRYPIRCGGLQFWPVPRLGVWMFMPTGPFTVDGINYRVGDATNERRLMVELIDDDEPDDDPARMRADAPMTDDEITDWLHFGSIHRQPQVIES